MVGELTRWGVQNRLAYRLSNYFGSKISAITGPLLKIFSHNDFAQFRFVFVLFLGYHASLFLITNPLLDRTYIQTPSFPRDGPTSAAAACVDASAEPVPNGVPPTLMTDIQMQVN